MCIILIGLDCHPEYKLIIAANRDEFYSRPSLPATFWKNSDILAGKDLSMGGTWMGITRDGRFAGLTNYRDPSRTKTEAKSRGKIVYDYLAMKSEPEYF